MKRDRDQSKATTDPGKGGVATAALRRCVLSFFLGLSILFWGGLADANQVVFSVQPSLTVSKEALAGTLVVTLHGDRPIYHPYLVGHGQQRSQRIAQWSFWESGESHTLPVTIPSQHLFPGSYHLLLELIFQDDRGDWHGVSASVPYTWGEVALSPPVHPAVYVLGDQITWDLAGLPPDLATLTLTTAPFHSTGKLLITPAVTQINLASDGTMPPPANARLEAVARLDWIWHGQHQSQIFPWVMETDGDGQWRRQPWQQEWGELWRWQKGGWWALAALLGMLATVAGGLRPPAPPAKGHFGAGIVEWLSVLAMMAWLVSYLPLELIATPGWPTGGELAVAGYHAKIFSQWHWEWADWFGPVWQGALLPDLPAGGAGLEGGMALKWLAVLPLLLLPLATHGLGMALGWPVASRLLATATSIGCFIAQGGHLGIQSWGLLLLVLLLTALSRFLRHPGITRPVWVVFLSVALLMSQMSSWLIAVVASLLFAVDNATERHLVALSKIYFISVLLVSGGWLFAGSVDFYQLVETGRAGEMSWQRIWPAVLWPFAVMWLFWRGEKDIIMPVAVAVVAGSGYVIAMMMGVDESKFLFPLQWGMVVAGGVLFGRWLTARSRRPVLWTLAFLAWLPAWWAADALPWADHIHWQLEGMEKKAIYPEWQKLAALLRRSPEGGRVLLATGIEEDQSGFATVPESLAGQGGVPVLMDAVLGGSIIAPFINQLTSEVSQVSPIASSFPVVEGSVDRLIAHMVALNVDTLVVRSQQTKARLLADPRLVQKAVVGPFVVVGLQKSEAALVSLVERPIVFEQREEWQEEAYSRFISGVSYKKLKAFLTTGQSPPFLSSSCEEGGEVHVVRLDRKKLIFQTNRPGCPHLIRLTYHPFWKSSEGEVILPVEPAFMLIYPFEKQVLLTFGLPWSSWLGLIVAASGIWLLYFWPSSPGVRWSREIVAESEGGVPWIPILLIFGVTMFFYWTNPERLFLQAMTSKNARQLDEIWSRREGGGRQSEALLRAAQAWEHGKNYQEAVKRYQKVGEEFSATPYAPEAIYRLALLRHKMGQGEAWAQGVAALQRRYPGNPWTLLAEGQAP